MEGYEPDTWSGSSQQNKKGAWVIASHTFLSMDHVDSSHVPGEIHWFRKNAVGLYPCSFCTTEYTIASQIILAFVKNNSPCKL